jgi:hypothetical protein
MNRLAGFTTEPLDLSHQDPPQSVWTGQLNVKRLASASACSQSIEQSDFSSRLRYFGLHRGMLLSFHTLWFFGFGSNF